MSEYQSILFDQEGPVAKLTINRPQSLNSLNQGVIEEMLEAILTEMNPDVRVLVIEGAGDKAFVAGADIKAMLDMTPIEALEFSRVGQNLLNVLEQIPQIVIGKIQGFALGGGCELALACDILVASTKASFGQPEANLGLIPGFGGTQRLVRRIGIPQAMDLLLTGSGRRLSGAEALALGLVSRLVAPEQLEEELEKVVKSILITGPFATREIKRLVREAPEMSLRAGLNSESTSFAACFSMGDPREGISAFLEKRTPSFE
jgi:enoyl-CoA hydratase